MRRKLIIDGNAVYEIDDECIKCKKNAGSQGNKDRKTAADCIDMHGFFEKVNKNAQNP